MKKLKNSIALYTAVEFLPDDANRAIRNYAATRIGGKARPCFLTLSA